MTGTPLSRHLVDIFDVNNCQLPPLWSISDFGDEEKVLNWCRNAVDVCERFYAPYFALQMQNLLIYQGAHWLHQDKYNARFLDNVKLIVARKTPRLVFNHCYDFVEHKVSRACRYRPAVAIFPANREQSDADNAKMSKDVLDSIWYTNTIDLRLQEYVRQASIFGESFMKIDFDFNKGEVHPDYLKLQKQGRRIPVLDENGQPVMGMNGDPLLISKCVRVGDVSYSNKAPWHYFEQPTNDRDKIEWGIEWDLEDVDYLRAKYPEKARKINPDATMSMVNDTSFDYGQLKNQVVVYKLYHTYSEFLEKGRHIKFTRQCVLEGLGREPGMGDLPFSHGKLPWIKIHDIDVPDCIRGMSFFQQIFPINHQINACASLIYKMLVLLAHPKIAMPDGACEMSQLLNEATVLEYQGGVPPTLLHMNPPTGELMSYMDKLTDIMQKVGGNYEISRGTAPSGVRAAKALRVLEEQEDKRSFGFITKYNQIGLVENAKMTLAVAGDYYDDSDGRLARVVGKDNEYRIRQFKAANLSLPYDIRIENTTALSQSASARFDEVNEMMQVRFDPTAPLTREQYTNLMDLGASDQFKDIVTRAVRCAQSENDDILAGLDVGDPTEDEDLIIHWKIHLQPVQGRDFKAVTPPDRKAVMKKHIFVTEYLMYEKAYGAMDSMGAPVKSPNLAFQQRLAMECPDWPVYFQIPVPNMAMGAPPPPGMPGMGMPPQTGAPGPQPGAMPPGAAAPMSNVSPPGMPLG